MRVPTDNARLPRHFHDRGASVATLDLLSRLNDNHSNEFQKAAHLQRYFDRLLNEELELLATSMLSIPCEPDGETRLSVHVLRGNWRMVALETASFMRRRAAKLLRDHQREDEE